MRIIVELIIIRGRRKLVMYNRVTEYNIHLKENVILLNNNNCNCVLLYIHIHTYIYMHTCMYVYMYVCIYV